MPLSFAGIAGCGTDKGPSSVDVENPTCKIYRSVNGSPAANITKLIDLMGGVESLFNPEDIVVIKPNLQWWNQGAPNLNGLKTFVDLIMSYQNGFRGEVIIAENVHRGSQPWTSAGWQRTFDRNADIPNISNMNELGGLLKKRYGNRFSVVHWIDVDSGGKRVSGPAEGTGYVYCDGTRGVPLRKYDNGAPGSGYREVIMTYPVFKTEAGTMVDFKNGIWSKGAYTGQPLRFINFAALNHHSTYCGATSLIKNYLGVSDLSGGADPFENGKIVNNYFNFHSFPFNKWSKGPMPGMLGGEIGCFLNTIRKADLNITSAHWTGLASRTEPPAVQTKAVLACSDPVALDYHAFKYILYPNSGISVHNPDNIHGPLYSDLKKCAEIAGFQFDEKHVAVNSYDFTDPAGLKGGSHVIIAKTKWGTDVKSLLKYLYMRIV